MGKSRLVRGDELSANATRHQYCLYLLAEAERTIYNSASTWSEAESSLIGNRLAKLAETLQVTAGQRRQ